MPEPQVLRALLGLLCDLVAGAPGWASRGRSRRRLQGPGPPVGLYKRPQGLPACSPRAATSTSTPHQAALPSAPEGPRRRALHQPQALPLLPRTRGPPPQAAHLSSPAVVLARAQHQHVNAQTAEPPCQPLQHAVTHHAEGPGLDLGGGLLDLKHLQHSPTQQPTARLPPGPMLSLPGAAHAPRGKGRQAVNTVQDHPPCQERPTLHVEKADKQSTRYRITRARP